MVKDGNTYFVKGLWLNEVASNGQEFEKSRQQDVKGPRVDGKTSSVERSFYDGRIKGETKSCSDDGARWRYGNWEQGRVVAGMGFGGRGARSSGGNERRLNSSDGGRFRRGDD